LVGKRVATALEKVIDGCGINGLRDVCVTRLFFWRRLIRVWSFACPETRYCICVTFVCASAQEGVTYLIRAGAVEKMLYASMGNELHDMAAAKFKYQKGKSSFQASR
jgi:hypothetical protein